MLAVALVDGEITLDSYNPERFGDPGAAAGDARITVAPADEFNAIRGQNRA